MTMSKPESLQNILTTARQSRQDISALSSFLDLELPPLPREQAEEEAMVHLLLGDPEAWAHEMGLPVEVALVLKAKIQENAV